MIHRDALIQQLLNLGIQRGGVLLVHTAFSKVGPVEGGPTGLISALHMALEARGTLVMPSMSYDDDHLFDRTKSHCAEMGVVADTFWRLPGVLRSDNNHAFAAVGLLQKVSFHSIRLTSRMDSTVPLAGSMNLTGRFFSWALTIHRTRPSIYARTWRESDTGAINTSPF